MNIRKAKTEDITQILKICKQAKDIMRSDGNMTQWTNGYPSKDIIKADIDNSVGYAIEENGNIQGYFAFIHGIEKTYLEINNGKWIDDTKPYATIHRLASRKDNHGIAQTCFNWCWNQIHNLRVDTHEQNLIMRHCVEKFGFIYCGIIHLQNGDPRMAYQKIDD